MTAFDPRTTDPEKTRPWTITIPGQVDDDLAFFAREFDTNKSKIIQKIIETCLTQIEHAETIGLFDISIIVRNFVDRIAEAMKIQRKRTPDTFKARTISFTLKIGTYEKLEYYAGKSSITPGKLAQNLISTGIDELNAAKRLGVIQLASFLANFGGKFWGKLGFLKGKDEIK